MAEKQVLSIKVLGIPPGIGWGVFLGGVYQTSFGNRQEARRHALETARASNMPTEIREYREDDSLHSVDTYGDEAKPSYPLPEMRYPGVGEPEESEEYPSLTALRLASLEDLMSELDARFDGGLFIGNQRRSKNEESYFTHWWGGHCLALGMVVRAQQRILKETLEADAGHGNMTKEEFES